MWPLSRRLLAGSTVVSLEEVAAAIRLLAERHRLIAEGAGAVPVAAALAGAGGAGKVVSVVSGGNLDPSRLAEILLGRLPE
jgi:threonine dehydratase